MTSDRNIAIRSVVVVRLVKSDVVFGVDNEVRSINVVALEDHIEDLWLMHSALLHKVYDLVLNHNSVVNVIIKLNLHLILQLSGLVQELLVLNWLSEIFVIFSEKVELADMCP